MTNLDVLGEIRRVWLLEHLNGVDKLVGDLLDRLESVAGEPSQHDWQPVAGRDAVENHTLRRHLKSRALWAHYSGLGKALNSMGPVHRGMIDQAVRIVVGSSESPEGHGLKQLTEGLSRFDPTAAFGETAVRRAIDGRTGETGGFPYRRPDNRPTGVLYGTTLIERTADPDEVDEVRKLHLGLARHLGKSEQATAIATHRKDAKAHRDGAVMLLREVRRSKDILRPCRYCKHLFDVPPSRKRLY